MGEKDKVGARQALAEVCSLSWEWRGILEASVDLGLGLLLCHQAGLGVTSGDPERSGSVSRLGDSSC